LVLLPAGAAVACAVMPKSMSERAQRRAVLTVGTLAMVAALAMISHAVPLTQRGRATGLLYGQQVVVSGSGATPGSEGAAVECNLAPGQPTIAVDSFQVPVGCADPYFGGPFGQSQVIVSSTGTFTAAVTVVTGTVGPPILGVDSLGRDASTDAAAYPCPPTAAQLLAGVTCGISFGTLSFGPSSVGSPILSDTASAPISFAAPAPPTTPTVAVAPSTGLSSGQSVAVTGSGFTPDSAFAVAECNISPGEPIGYEGFPGIGCTQSWGSYAVSVLGPPSLPPVTGPDGSLSQHVTVEEGNLGGTAASAAYPCPPTAAQVAAGGHCAVVVDDGAGERVASAPLSITGPVPVPAVSVTPSTGLSAGRTVTVDASGLTPGTEGAVVECSLAPGQPTVEVDGIAAPVSCSNPFDGSLLLVSLTGTASMPFTIHTGVLGPPQSGTDSTGGSAAAAAAAYPCPPTRAQQLAGVTCGIGVGDLAGQTAYAPITFAPPAPAVPGYRMVASDGGIFAFGDAGFYGSMGGHVLARPIVGMAATPDGKGYWMVASDGGIFAFGDAGFYGSMGGHVLARPVVGMASTPDGKGYWEVASDGAVYAFGDAGFFGSTAGTVMAAPVVGMAATPDGKGYWLVGSDGGVYAFGDAAFFGSAGSLHLNRPIVGMASTADGKGYWLVASDGGIFSYGDAPFHGSAGSLHLNRPIVGMASTPDGGGYWLVAADGGIFAYGAAAFSGSTGSLALVQPMVGMTAG
jgi:hypothetical protein